MNKGEFANAVSLNLLPNSYARSKHPISVNQ